MVVFCYIELKFILNMSNERRPGIPPSLEKYSGVTQLYSRLITDIAKMGEFEDEYPHWLTQAINKDISKLRAEVERTTPKRNRTRPVRLDPVGTGTQRVYNQIDGNIYIISEVSIIGNVEIKPGDPIIPQEQWINDPELLSSVAGAIILPVPRALRVQFQTPDLN